MVLLRRGWLTLFVSLIWVVEGAHNVTVDDTDPLIQYSPPGGWDTTSDDPLNIGNSHQVANDPSSTATFTFTGTAVYYYSPLWPFGVTTALSLDGSPPLTLSLLDSSVPFQDQGAETQTSAVRWSMTGLDNIPHTLVVSVAVGDNLAVIDAISYTVVDATDSTTSSSSSSSSSSTTTTSTRTLSVINGPTVSPQNAVATPGTKKGLSIALGLVCTIFGVLVLGALFWWWRRRRRQREEEEAERRLGYLPQQGDMMSESNASLGNGNGHGRPWPRFGPNATAAAAVAASNAARRRQPPSPPSLTSSSSSSSLPPAVPSPYSHPHTTRRSTSTIPPTPSPLNPAARRQNMLTTIPESLPRDDPNTLSKVGREGSLSSGTLLDKSMTNPSTPTLTSRQSMQDEWTSPPVAKHLS